MSDADDLREEIDAGLRRAGLTPAGVSKTLGRSKDYVADFLRGSKATIGHKELTAIREMIARQFSGSRSDDDGSTGVEQRRSYIRVDLASFREAVFSTLRTCGVSPVLARSRIDDLLEDLKALSEDHALRRSTETAHIQIGSPTPLDDDPSA